MIRYEFNKLIRSKIPKRMIVENVSINGKELSDCEFIAELKNKIVEEAQEVSSATDRENLIAELADVTEVIHAIAKASDITLEEIESERLTKLEVNGDFQAPNYINYIEVEEDNHKVIEYQNNKNRPYKLEMEIE